MMRTIKQARVSKRRASKTVFVLPTLSNVNRIAKIVPVWMGLQDEYELRAARSSAIKDQLERVMPIAV